MIKPRRTENPYVRVPCLVVACLVMLCVCICAVEMHAQTEITTDTLRDEHIRVAMRAIVDELYTRQDDETHWEPSYSADFERDQQGGWTALVTLALLYSGESYQNERLRKAVEYLESVEMHGTYAVALRAHVWALLPPKFEALLERDKKWLFEGFSDRSAGWYYTKDPYTTRRDHSIAQYGALALWECAKRGSRVENRYWKILEDAFIARQVRDGGWNYDGTGPSYGSMTAAGLTVLFITQDYLHAHEAVKLGRAEPSANERAIEKGTEWFSRNFSADTNPGRARDFYYYLYGVERVGLAGGIRYFGDHDWFREGAAQLIRRLCDWNPDTGKMTVYRHTGGDARAGGIRTIDLSFALMFLSRGRVPGAINKLSDATFAWNNRPRDVANLTRYIRGKSEAGLNWQVVSINAPPQEWLTAPLLYIASNEAPPWMQLTEQQTIELREKHRQIIAQSLRDPAEPDALSDLGLPDELLRIKKYLDLGGTILANAEGKSKGFSESLVRAGRVLYPNYEWRSLPQDHPVYSLFQLVPRQRVPLRALSNGIRELIILSDGVDLSEFFQSNSTKSEDQFAMGMNMYLYASEMNRSRPRIEPHVMERNDVKVSAVRVSIVHATHSGAWDVEPLALDVFSAWAWNERGLDVQLRTAPLDTIDTITPAPTLVCVNGTDAVVFSPEEMGAIQRYAEMGGVILFETTGGVGDFTLEAEKQIRSVLRNPVRSLMRNPVVTGENLPRTRSISRVAYRPFSFTVFGARETAPRLRGMLFGDQPRILFSREDMFNGLLNQPSWGIAGYTPEWARDLMGNIVRYGHSIR